VLRSQNLRPREKRATQGLRLGPRNVLETGRTIKRSQARVIDVAPGQIERDPSLRKTDHAVSQCK